MASLLSAAMRASRNLRGGVRSAYSRAARGLELSYLSEEWLWRRLAGSKTGWPFRRQLVIGEHIVDLACTKVRLVVEVDGGSHAGRERHDEARDRALAALGWEVLRVAEHEVLSDLDEVVARIVRASSSAGTT